MKLKQISVLTGTVIFCLCLNSSSLSATVVTKSYTWAYNKKIYRMEHEFDQNSYDYYHKLRRTYTSFLTYLDESKYFPVIESVADEFKKIAAANNFSDWQTVECLIAFVQSIDYVSDGTYEYPKFPIETLMEQGGDCEDSAILLEALLRELGFNAVLVSPTNHMGVGIALNSSINGTAFPYHNTDYYYIETTSEGWGIGDYPPHLSPKAEVYDPGQTAESKLLSADAYSFTSTITATSVEDTKTDVSTSRSSNTTSQSNSNSADYQYTPSKNTIGTSTIDVDEMVIDGEKQTVITQQVEQNGEVKIIATEQ